MTGEVTFPGEPPDTLHATGTWSMNADRATLTTSEGTAEWAVNFAGAEATLTMLGPQPTNVIRLRKRDT
jgi:hypothetical protein